MENGFFFVFIPKVKEEYSLKTFKNDMGYLFKKAGLIADEKNRNLTH